MSKEVEEFYQKWTQKVFTKEHLFEFVYNFCLMPDWIRSMKSRPMTNEEWEKWIKKIESGEFEKELM